VLRHLHPLGDRPCRSLADRGARVPEVLPTAELEGFLTGLIIARSLEPVGGAAVGDDVVEAPAGGDDAGQEGAIIDNASELIQKVSTSDAHCKCVIPPSPTNGSD